jgi:hypothetical protein
MNCALLANILIIQGKLNTEVEKLLAIDIQNYGPDGADTSLSHFFLGNFYHCQAESGQVDSVRTKLLRRSELKCIEVVRIRTKIYGPNNPRDLVLLVELLLIKRKSSGLE